MSSATLTKDDRINLRLQHNAKQMLERAAGFEGKTISKFILGCALAQAEKTIHEHETIRLNAQDSAAFFDAIAAPVPYNNELATALDEHDRRVTAK
jgi:uncharacterized protein (DUF1778 family)